MYGVHYQLPIWVLSPVLFIQFFLLQGALEPRYVNAWRPQASVHVDEINQLLPVSHIGMRDVMLVLG
jgi:hypothetical protein